MTYLWRLKNKTAIERLSWTSWKNPTLPLSRGEKYVRTWWKFTKMKCWSDLKANRIRFTQNVRYKDIFEERWASRDGTRNYLGENASLFKCFYSAEYVEGVIAFLFSLERSRAMSPCWYRSLNVAVRSNGRTSKA